MARHLAAARLLLPALLLLLLLLAGFPPSAGKARYGRNFEDFERMTKATRDIRCDVCKVLVGQIWEMAGTLPRSPTPPPPHTPEPRFAQKGRRLGC